MRLFAFLGLTILLVVSVVLCAVGSAPWEAAGRVGSVASILAFVGWAWHELRRREGRSKPQRDAAADSAQKALARIAGRWHLDYYRGDKPRPEDLRIDARGNYYIDQHPEHPYCRLENLVYEANEKRIRWTKVRTPNAPPGKPQIEILQINEDFDEMIGYAEHDGHRLEYRRRPE